jgi:hypothetical protein
MAGYSNRPLAQKLGIRPATKVVALDTDLTEDVVRELGLKERLVDVKVCAIDEVWSGLKFVRRIENRCS